MVTKEQKTKRRRITALLATCALAIAAIAGVSFFGGSASAAANNSSAEYGEQLKDESPASLKANGATTGWANDLTGWNFLDDEKNNYFGTAGEQNFVITNGEAYDNLKVNVKARTVNPTIKLGSIDLSAYKNPQEEGWNGNASKAKIDTYKHTLTMSGTGTVGGGTYAQGQTVQVKAEAPTGYEFWSWEVVTGKGAKVASTNSASTTFTMGSNDATLKANYKASYLTNGQYPTTSGQVSVMTMKELYDGWSAHSSGAASSFLSGDYLIYADGKYVGAAGQRPLEQSSTAENRSPIAADKRPANGAYRTANNTPAVFGGALYLVGSSGSGYYFDWYDSTSSYGSGRSYGWNSYVGGDTVVTVVRR